MRLAEDGNNLRHLKTERPVLVGERGAMTLRLMLLSFGRVRPNLDALPGEWSPVTCTAYGTTHPKATLADPIHDRRALAVVVGPARHRRGRCDALRAHGQQESGNPGCQDGGASGEEVAAIEYDDGHGNSSWRPCSCSADRTARDALSLARLRPISIDRNNRFVNTSSCEELSKASLHASRSIASMFFSETLLTAGLTGRTTKRSGPSGRTSSSGVSTSSHGSASASTTGMRS